MKRRIKPRLYIKKLLLGAHLIMPKRLRRGGVRGGKRLHEWPGKGFSKEEWSASVVSSLVLCTLRRSTGTRTRGTGK